MKFFVETRDHKVYETPKYCYKNVVTGQMSSGIMTKGDFYSIFKYFMKEPITDYHFYIPFRGYISFRGTINHWTEE